MNGAKQTRVIVGVIYAAAVATLFGSRLIQLFKYAMHNEVNSFVVLVPFVCAYLLWIRKSSLTPGSQPALWQALGLTVAASLVWIISAYLHPTYWMPDPADQLTLFTLSFVLFVWAGAFLFLGRGWMSSAAFPMFFLIFMVPLPSGIVDALENASKLASAEAANLFFSLTGTPTLRDGNVFQLPGITIEVAQECSGIRSSYMLILTGLVAGTLFLTKTWSRTLLVFFVIPLGIIRNGFRVWVIATLCIHMGPQMIHSVIHRRGGPAFFILSLIPLLLFIWWLRWLEERQGVGVQEPPKGSASPTALAGEASRLDADTRNVFPS